MRSTTSTTPRPLGHRRAADPLQPDVRGTRSSLGAGAIAAAVPSAPGSRWEGDVGDRDATVVGNRTRRGRSSAGSSREGEAGLEGRRPSPRSRPTRRRSRSDGGRRRGRSESSSGEGATVPIGGVIASYRRALSRSAVRVSGACPARAPAAPYSPPRADHPVLPAPGKQPTASGPRRSLACIARESHIDLRALTGSGPGGQDRQGSPRGGGAASAPAAPTRQVARRQGHRHVRGAPRSRSLSGWPSPRPRSLTSTLTARPTWRRRSSCGRSCAGPAEGRTENGRRRRTAAPWSSRPTTTAGSAQAKGARAARASRAKTPPPATGRSRCYERVTSASRSPPTTA